MLFSALSLVALIALSSAAPTTPAAPQSCGAGGNGDDLCCRPTGKLTLQCVSVGNGASAPITVYLTPQTSLPGVGTGVSGNGASGNGAKLGSRRLPNTAFSGVDVDYIHEKAADATELLHLPAAGGVTDTGDTIVEHGFSAGNRLLHDSAGVDALRDGGTADQIEDGITGDDSGTGGGTTGPMEKRLTSSPAITILKEIMSEAKVSSGPVMLPARMIREITLVVAQVEGGVGGIGA